MDQPLGLTVHAMPTPDQAAVAQRSRMGRWKMVFILLVCASPVIASYLTYYLIRPEGRRNFGELIAPARPLPELQATRLDGVSVALNTLKNQWLLVSVAPAACDAVCQENLYFQRQMRESLAEKKTAWTVSGWSVTMRKCLHHWRLRWREPPCCACLPTAWPLGLSLRQVINWANTCTWSIPWAIG